MEFPLSLTDSERRVERHSGVRPVEFLLSFDGFGTPRNATWNAPGTRALWSSPLAWRIPNAAECYVQRHGGPRPVEFPLSLTDSERHVQRHGGPRPVEFPLSLTDSERRRTPRGIGTPRYATWNAASARILWSSPLAWRIRNAAERRVGALNGTRYTPLADACERLRTLCGHNATTFGNHPSQLLKQEPFCGAFGKRNPTEAPKSPFATQALRLAGSGLIGSNLRGWRRGGLRAADGAATRIERGWGLGFSV